MTKLLAWEEYREIHVDDGYSYSQFCHRYNDWRSQQQRSMRQTHIAGEKCFVDYCGPTIPVVNASTGEFINAQIFVAVLGASNYTYADASVSQKEADWINSHSKAAEFFGGWAALTIPDNLKSGVTKTHRYTPVLNASYERWAEHYGTGIIPARPHKPKDKGRVEAGVKYVKNNFTPLRTFRDLVDANKQLSQWVMTVAGTREHGTTRVAPLTRFAETEKALLKPLPASAPELATWAQAKVHGDCHIQVKKRRYSAPYKLVSQTLDVRLSEGTVRLYHQHALVATHPRLSNPGQRSTVDEHLPPEHIAFKMRDPQWCQVQAEQIGPHCNALIQKLFSNGVLDRLRAAQGIVGLRKRFGDARLDAACRRALAFENLRYGSIKTILERGLDQVTDPEGAFDQLCDTYTGSARFGRDTRDLFDTH